MRIMLCWAGISGYMAACWRELAALPGVEHRVLALAPRQADNAPFRADIMAGVQHRLLDERERQDEGLLRAEVEAFRPDLLLISGWFHKPYNRLVTHPPIEGMKTLMTSDLPWDGSLRRRIGAVVLRSHVARFDGVWVTGERATQYMRRMGVAPTRIFTGLYGIDAKALSPVAEARKSGEWPRRFLFTGRYVMDKGVDTLVAAYMRYRKARADAWELVCCGHGPLAAALADQEGIVDRGFVQPAEMPTILSQTGAFVLPSRSDPWPLVLAEACTAGLPIIATDACGNTVELLRHLDNGVRVPAGDVSALASAMAFLHDRYEQLPRFGEVSRALVTPYSAAAWARRLRSIGTLLLA